MRVTDFWNSLRNSLIITLAAVGLSIAVHSIMGYALGRNKAGSKFYSFVYLFIVSGMFVPFAILMMPLAERPDLRAGHEARGVLHAHEHSSLFRIPCKYTDGS